MSFIVDERYYRGSTMNQLLLYLEKDDLANERYLADIAMLSEEI